MWHKKSFIIVAIISVVVIAGVLGGFAMASADDQTTTTTPGNSANVSALMEKVATIYQQNTGVAIDPQALADAFKQAGKDMRSEALDNYLNKLVEQNKITSEQAQQFKDWINARPDVPVGPGMGPGMGERFFGKFNGRFGGGMFRGWCGPGNGNSNGNGTTDQ
jgi:hypothetical protein